MKLSPVLRAATCADEPFLLTLRKLTMTEHLEHAGEPIDEAAHYARMRFHFDDAQIIGYGEADIGLLKLARPGSEWYLYQIQILPEHQSKGLGSEIIAELLVQAKEAGATVSLNVLRGNPALRLYERLGFSIASESAIDFVMKCRP